MTEIPADNENQAAPESPSLGSRVAWPVRRAWWALQEGVFWRASDVGRALADDARWPFERIAWAVRRYLVWPVVDLFGNRGALGRSGLAATVLIAGGAAAFGGAQLADRSEPAPAMQQVAQVTAPVAEVENRVPNPVAADPEPEPTGPVLQGVAPTFEPVSNEDGEDAGATSTADDSSADSDSGDEDAANVPDPESVPQPLAVARRFAAAFVSYEIGEGISEARTVFRETASPALAKALADRPPRQPASVEVPKAKVLNIVPGPRRDKMLAVSVSLLRLGATSELRLDLERTDEGNWLVGDVRG